MQHPVMQKLDAMTPYHVLREYPTMQEAMFQAYQWAKDRKPGEKFPKYSVDGREF